MALPSPTPPTANGVRLCSALRLAARSHIRRHLRPRLAPNRRQLVRSLAKTRAMLSTLGDSTNAARAQCALDPATRHLRAGRALVRGEALRGSAPLATQQHRKAGRSPDAARPPSSAYSWAQ